MNVATENNNELGISLFLWGVRGGGYLYRESRVVMMNGSSIYIEAFIAPAALCRSPLEAPGQGVGADDLPARCAGPLVGVTIGAQSELAQ